MRQGKEKASFDSPGIYLPEAGKNERKHKSDERIFGLRFFHVKLPLEILPILPQRKTPCNESIAEKPPSSLTKTISWTLSWVSFWGHNELPPI